MSYDFSEFAKVIEINSYTKNIDGVNRCGEFFKQRFEEIGYESKIFKRENFGNHILFTSPKSSGKKMLLLGHLDTVFPPGTFEGFKEDEKWVYGPGVCDMKGGIMVMLEALREQKSIKNIDIFLVSDEEIGSDDSKAFTLKIASEYDYCLVFEAAGKNDEIVTARKGIGTFYVDIQGKAAHAGNSYTEGVDANLELAYKLISFSNLTNLQEGTTVNVGKIEGGIGANTISPHAKMILEARFTKSSERDRVLASINEIVNTSFVEGSFSKLSGGLQRDVMEENSKQYELIELIKKWSNTDIKTEKRGGGSDANIAASAGAITLDGFGPFGEGDHTIYEKASKKSYLNRIEFVSKIFKGFMNSLS
jgi:glutamate carboxypeptidase